MSNLESQGIQIYWSTGTGTTLISTGSSALIGQVVGFNGPTGSAGKIDVTNLGSTAKEFLMGLRDEGDLSLDVMYDPADLGQARAFVDRGTRTLRAWAIKLTNSTTAGEILYVKGLGYMTGFAVTGAVDDAVKASLTISITGAVNVSTGTTFVST